MVTRDPTGRADGVLVAHSLDEALAVAAAQPGETFVVGGTQVYEQALPLATHQVLTEVDLSPDGDAHYPDSTWRSGSRPGASRATASTWVWWERRSRG